MTGKYQFSPSIIRVLMVCLGNICRSPTAHGILEKQINNNNLKNYIYVDSAGTGDGILVNRQINGLLKLPRSVAFK